MAWFCSRFDRLGAAAAREAIRPFLPVRPTLEAAVRKGSSALRSQSVPAGPAAAVGHQRRGLGKARA